MVKWLFHVGYSKTGTTALQGFLALNRRVLLQRSVLYPDAKRAGLRLGLENHNVVAGALAGLPDTYGISAEAYFRQFKQQITDSPGTTLVILSAEGFTGHPNVLLYETEGEFRAAEDRYVAQLRALCKPHDAGVIVYLRRQDLWLDSTANQRIKFEGRNAGPLFDTMDRFHARQKPRLDYLASLDCWARHFGSENITVRPYERAQLAGGSVVSDFLETAGIEPARLSIPEPAGKGDVNPSLSMDVLEFKRRINPTLKSRFEAEVTGEMLSRISAEMGGGKGRLLGPALRRSILGECAAGNREIARRYLGREDGELFREPWPDPDEAWEPYPGLSSQTEAEIARRLQQRRRSLAGRAFILRKRASAVLQDRIPWAHVLTRSFRQALSRR